jgi:hypothetical protein
MRKVGALYPLWNQQLFIKPHLDMVLPHVDRCVVLMQPGPLPSYRKEHGYSTKKDHTEDIVKHYFPQVEIIQSTHPNTEEFGCELYNEGLELMQDCDIVTRFDPDMFWTPEVMKEFFDYIRSTEFDCYKMDFHNDSVNYSITGDYEHGLKDAQEYDPLAIDPKKLFEPVLRYPAVKPVIYKANQWMCHHFRGWNKPKSTPVGWEKTQPADYIELYGDHTKKNGWYHTPQWLRDIINTWLEELDSKWKSKQQQNVRLELIQSPMLTKTDSN